jgi:hypothetical protein
VFLFEGPGVWTGGVSKGCAQVVTVGADETEPARAGGVDVELPVVVGQVVAFTQQQQVVQVGTAAVDPVDAVMGVQIFGVRAAGVGAVAVVAQH